MRAGLDVAHRKSIAAVIVDWKLPDGDAPSFCRSARTDGVRAFLLVLSDSADRNARVLALEAGADDFMVKQFVDPREVVARLTVLEQGSKHGEQLFSPRTERSDKVPRHDEVMRQVYWKDEVVELTPTESALFARLRRSQEAVTPWSDLVDCFRTKGKSSDRQELTVYMATLRAKIRGLGFSIKSVRGVGYVLQGPTKSV